MPALTKTRAHAAVAKAVRLGELTRQPCSAVEEGEVCGREPAHAHHDDYDKPLEVRWLCTLHHRRTHASLNAAMRSGIVSTVSQRRLRELDLTSLEDPVYVIRHTGDGYTERVALLIPIWLVDE